MHNLNIWRATTAIKFLIFKFGRRTNVFFCYSLYSVIRYIQFLNMWMMQRKIFVYLSHPPCILYQSTYAFNAFSSHWISITNLFLLLGFLLAVLCYQFVSISFYSSLSYTCIHDYSEKQDFQFFPYSQIVVNEISCLWLSFLYFIRHFYYIWQFYY